jgi:hypothetical protein
MKIPAKGSSHAEVMASLDAYGEHDLPWREDGTTGISTMLNAMKPEVAAKVMTEFFNDLYVSR